VPSLSSGEEGGDVDEEALLEVWEGLVSLRVSGTVAKGMRLESESGITAATVGSAMDDSEEKECAEEGREEVEIQAGPEVDEEGDGVAEAEAEVVPGEEEAIEEDERDEMSPGDIFEEAETSLVEEEGMAKESV
jgi:hypothetical protein